MKRSRFALVSTLILILTLLLTACSTGSKAPTIPAASGSAQLKQATLKIGVMGPLSGGGAAWGLSMKRAADMFVEKANASGGIEVGDTAYKLEIISYDHKAQAAEAATVANRLIFGDGVKYILGNAVGATCSAVQPISEPQKVIFTFVCWGDNIGPRAPYSFRSWPGAAEAAPLLYSWIKKNRPNIKKVALIAPNDQSGTETADAVAATAKGLGMEVLPQGLFERNSQDFIPLLTRILANKPDMIDLTASPPGEGSLILKQAYELGYRGDKAWTASTDLAPVVKIAGIEATNGMWNIMSWDLASEVSNPKLQEWAKLYKQKYNEDAILTGAANYASFEVVTQAMKKVGSIDTEKVLKAMEADQRWDTILGPLLVGGQELYKLRRQFLYPLVINEMKGGKILPLAEVKPLGL